MGEQHGPERADDRCGVVVVGASAGGVEALQVVVRGLDPGLSAAVFVVLHIAPDSTSVLPRILARASPLPAAHAVDGERVEPARIYVAPPDRHLALTQGSIHVYPGAHENRHRPAVDVLFRTAARAYGPRVVGVVLSGNGDDGTAGLMEIRRRGGVAVVQRPEDALSPGMPRSALEFAGVDHCIPASEIGSLVSRLCREGAGLPVPSRTPEGETMEPSEDRVRAGPEHGFTCPHCNGHLWEQNENGLLRFRCRVGHTYSAESLLAGQYEELESSLWAALNALEENVALSRRLQRRAMDHGHSLTARRLQVRVSEAERHVELLRSLLASGTFTMPPPLASREAEGAADVDPSPVVNEAAV